MNSNEILISVGIIGGITALFGSIGFLCCYFKNKCTTLNEPEPEFRHLRSTSKASSNSAISDATSGSDNNSVAFRRTLFQIVIGQDPMEKPSRARVERKSIYSWSRKLSFLGKSKPGKPVKPLPRASDLETMEEGIEEDPREICGKIPSPS
ncbi:unnamed protein product [Allacma fusca]|uniref:Uncharacterized protein n=1 Tax=Allacma fusca TaxID=39272 RepID=A0A8J2NGP1_9HEXA|nr:unnamed protein product [Allacma fusca]